MEYTETKITEEQRLKLHELFEAQNPKPRNRTERREQERRNRRERSRDGRNKRKNKRKNFHSREVL